VSEETAPTTDYIAYPKAMKILADRLGATPGELAMWIFIGPDAGGLAAYEIDNELNSLTRFDFGYYVGEDYRSPLMGCRFLKVDIDRFDPADHFITHGALVKRWSNRPNLNAEAFIRAKITESRLQDMHPISGFTQGTHPGDSLYPKIEWGLFSLADVESIEAEDFGDSESDKADYTETKPKGNLNHDLQLQQRANEIAADIKKTTGRSVTRDKVAKLLAKERNMDEATVTRRIRKEW
jgi:hypothetical protein